MFNLDAVIAEETGKPFTFQFAGEKYTLPPSLDAPAAVLLASGDGTQMAEGLKRLLGAEQWGRIVASDQVLTVPAIGALLEAYTAHTGATPGESSASSRS